MNKREISIADKETTPYCSTSSIITMTTENCEQVKIIPNLQNCIVPICY